MFDPRKRIDATQSLAHPYVAPYHDPTDEPVATDKFDWSFNGADLPVETWKVMMYNEILSESCSLIPYDARPYKTAPTGLHGSGGAAVNADVPHDLTVAGTNFTYSGHLTA